MKVKGILLLDGWARKVGLVAISASLLGWLIFVICFGSFNNGTNFYNDVREKNTVRVRSEAFEGSGIPQELRMLFLFLSQGEDVDYVNLPVDQPGNVLLTEKAIEEDFPENRADPDFFTYYWFAVVFPVAALLTIAHLFLHGVPVLGFIISLAAHMLLTLSLVCGAGAFWAVGNRLYSDDNNYRDETNDMAGPLEVVPEDWRTDPYWGAWLVGEWVGLLLAGICVIFYYTITPFFTNRCTFFTKSNESYEMQGGNEKGGF